MPLGRMRSSVPVKRFAQVSDFYFYFLEIIDALSQVKKNRIIDTRHIQTHTKPFICLENGYGHSSAKSRDFLLPHILTRGIKSGNRVGVLLQGPWMRIWNARPGNPLEKNGPCETTYQKEIDTRV